VSLLLIGGDFITTPGKSPPLGLDSFFTSSMKILDITQVKTPREKLNPLEELLDEVKKLIELVLITSRFDDFKDFTEKRRDFDQSNKCTQS
jgi:hypothetical protein